jgi:hypothetical protein
MWRKNAEDKMRRTKIGLILAAKSRSRAHQRTIDGRCVFRFGSQLERLKTGQNILPTASGDKCRGKGMCRRNGRGRGEKIVAANPENHVRLESHEALEAGDGDEVWESGRLGQPPLFTFPLPGKPILTAFLIRTGFGP